MLVVSERGAREHLFKEGLAWKREIRELWTKQQTSQEQRARDKKRRGGSGYLQQDRATLR